MPIDLSETVADLGADGRRRTSHEFVLSTLRRAIVTGVLPGGARLVQAEIAAQLGVSITPVREALRDLAAEGLVQIDVHRGGVVCELQPAEMREIYMLRTLLEPECMRLAAERISPDELAEAEELHDRMGSVTEVGDWVEFNRQFHAILTDAARSPRLVGMVASLRDLATICVGLGMRTVPDRAAQIRAGNEEHGHLLEAFRAGDGELAARLIVEHLQGTVDIVDGALATQTATRSGG